MPRFRLHTCDGGMLYPPIQHTDSLQEAWFWADVLSKFQPTGVYMLAFEGDIPALLVTTEDAQYGLWHYQEE